ncbi:hypothetical protein [Mangrovibacterium marinum]|uniref:Uncharacterized protein n=1 Tax=Mangrovibacterium marinum TaxID=1639118 RepID=A0A2T5BXQ3_9BACT|nr:hypothetical protein [Mangrovibacterium marinum]PTN05607.1 hypothetical protein C8N47_12626 [Mangrovibacterium marinum]
MQPKTACPKLARSLGAFLAPHQTDCLFQHLYLQLQLAYPRLQSFFLVLVGLRAIIGFRIGKLPGQGSKKIFVIILSIEETRFLQYKRLH